MTVRVSPRPNFPFPEPICRSYAYVSRLQKSGFFSKTGNADLQTFPTVLILPINAFGSGQAHSNSGSPEDPTALVHHLFKGSWKADHPPADAQRSHQQRDLPAANAVLASAASSDDG